MNHFIQALMNAGRWAIPALLAAVLWAVVAIFLVTKVLGGSFFGGILLALLAVPFYYAVRLMPRLRNALLLVGALIFIGAFLAATGIIPVGVRSNISRYQAGAMEELGNSFAKRALKSERESGIFAWTTSTGVAYASPNGIVFEIAGQQLRVPGNQKVRVVTLNGEPVTANGPEGMTQVMLQDSNRDYVSGQKVWIPSRRLTFGKTASLFGKEEDRWGEDQVFEVALDDPRGADIELEDGHYRVWADWRTRIQYTDHLKGGQYLEVYPDGYFPKLGRTCRGNKMSRYLPVPEAAPWAVLLRRAEADRGISFVQKGFETDVVGGRVNVNLNCPSGEVPDERIDPALNWIRNGGTVRIHFQRRL